MSQPPTPAEKILKRIRQPQPIMQKESHSPLPTVPRELRPQQPVYRRVIAIITKNVNGLRIVLRTLNIPVGKDMFRFAGHTFYIDISRAVFVSNKGIYLMYDYDVTEPLDKSIPESDQINTPIQLGDTAHYSKNVDLLMTGNVVAQALKSLGESSQFNLMTIALMVVGVALGFFMGQVIRIGGSPTAISNTTRTITVTSAKMLIDSIRIWLP
jgi:hypothetical protein